jgi:hypothetical protein
MASLTPGVLHPILAALIKAGRVARGAAQTST